MRTPRYWRHGAARLAAPHVLVLTAGYAGATVIAGRIGIRLVALLLLTWRTAARIKPLVFALGGFFCRRPD